MDKISKKKSEKIQQIITNFVSDSEPFLVMGENSVEKLDLRKIAEEINVLPVALDWFASFGLNPDGTVISFTFDKPYEIEIIENQKIINMVFFDASKKYAELKELMPIRNSESIICPGCEGTGIVKEFALHEMLSKSVRCNCGGVGWLPSSDEKYLYF